MRLSAHGCHVVGLEFAGMPRDSFATQAQFFGGQLMHLIQPGASTVILVGYSSGSALAHELALALQALHSPGSAIREPSIHLLLVDRNPWSPNEPLALPIAGHELGGSNESNDDLDDEEWLHALPQRRLFMRYAPSTTFGGPTALFRIPGRSAPAHVDGVVDIEGATHYDILKNEHFLGECTAYVQIAREHREHETGAGSAPAAARRH